MSRRAGARGDAREREAEAAARHHHDERPRREQQGRECHDQPGGVESACSARRPRAHQLARRGERQARLLARRRARVGSERARQQLLLRGRAPHLAARGLEHDARRDEHHPVGRHLDRGCHALDHSRLQPGALLGIARARLGDHDQRLGAERRVLHAEGDDTAAADARHLGGGLLDLLRDQVAAGLDDQVLAPAADVDLAVGAVGQVAAVEPAARQRDRGGRFRVVVVAARHRRAAEHEPTDDALRQ